MGAEEGQSDLSLLPLLLIAGLVVAVIAIVTAGPPVSTLRGYLQPTVRLMQLICLATYVVIGGKYAIDSGLLEEYDYVGRTSELLGEIGGPIMSLVAEIAQILAFLELSMSLFKGISLYDWTSDLSVVNYWLLTLLACALFGLAILNWISRLRDFLKHWPNTEEILG